MGGHLRRHGRDCASIPGLTGWAEAARLGFRREGKRVLASHVNGHRIEAVSATPRGTLAPVLSGRGTPSGASFAMWKPMNTRHIAIYFLDEVLGILGMSVALFWSAGRIYWWPAWAAIAVMSVCMTAMSIVILRYHPDLLVERLRPPKGAKTWDRAILSMLRLTQLARYILAGLDQRHG